MSSTIHSCRTVCSLFLEWHEILSSILGSFGINVLVLVLVVSILTSFPLFCCVGVVNYPDSMLMFGVFIFTLPNVIIHLIQTVVDPLTVDAIQVNAPCASESETTFIWIEGLWFVVWICAAATIAYLVRNVPEKCVSASFFRVNEWLSNNGVVDEIILFLAQLRYFHFLFVQSRSLHFRYFHLLFRPIQAFALAYDWEPSNNCWWFNTGDGDCECFHTPTMSPKRWGGRRKIQSTNNYLKSVKNYVTGATAFFVLPNHIVFAIQKEDLCTKSWFSCKNPSVSGTFYCDGNR